MDIYIIGPFDLSNSLGCVCQWESPLYKKYINKIYSVVNENKLGIFLPTFKTVEQFKSNINECKIAPKLIVWGMDTDFIKSGISAIKL